MKLLLDTQAFLWFFIGDASLSPNARALIEDPSNEKFFSVASLWEIAIKVSIGKLILTVPFEEIFPRLLPDHGINLLSLAPAHLSIVANLPFHHRDPFDRVIIAQAMIEQMQIVSVDQAFDNYSVSRLW